MIDKVLGQHSSIGNRSTVSTVAKGDLKSQRAHYDHVYFGVSAEKLVRLATCPGFLPYAAETLTSWHGLYRGRFETRLKGRRVLELGAGDGLNALLMARHGADVMAFEISPIACQRLQEASRVAGLPITTCSEDFLDVDLPEFDFVVGKAFLHHLPRETEEQYFAKIAAVLAPGGEARFVEPAVNSKVLDSLRWLVPVPGRPSVLQRGRFREWKEKDPHPDRPFSTRHFREASQRYFNDVRIEAFGGLKRFERFFRDRSVRDSVGRVCLRLESCFMPQSLGTVLARTQVIILREPRRLA